VSELATWLREHGAAHLSLSERVELAERITRRRFLRQASRSACASAYHKLVAMPLDKIQAFSIL
jgi:hypothetical protein